jgi:hypothetical protein
VVALSDTAAMKIVPLIDRKTGEILVDYLFDNSFRMIRNFIKAMEGKNINPIL